MKQFLYTPNGVNVSDEEKSSALDAAKNCAPAGWVYTGYIRFRHGETARHRTWIAEYSNGKAGRSRRTKNLDVLEAVPA